jgi:fructoselysine-6-P-deglycase FrlB-like protein
MEKKLLNKFKVYQEAISIPEKIINFLEDDNNNYKSISNHLLSKSINNVVTVARGSSDNAALYSSYLITRYTGLPVFSFPF